MKTIIEPTETSAGLSMGRLEVLKHIDSESVKVRVPFFVGTIQINVLGTLNIETNTFHWNSENEASVETYFAGFRVDIPSVIERR